MQSTLAGRGEWAGTYDIRKSVHSGGSVRYTEVHGWQAYWLGRSEIQPASAGVEGKISTRTVATSHGSGSGSSWIGMS
jgi:hypothetical protein